MKDKPMATNFTQQLQQDYPKAWEAFRVWLTDYAGIYDPHTVNKFGVQAYIVQQGVLEAFGRNRGYDVFIAPLGDHEYGWLIYNRDTGYRLVDKHKMRYTNHQPAHQAAVAAMFAEIEKEK